MQLDIASAFLAMSVKHHNSCLLRLKMTNFSRLILNANIAKLINLDLCWYCNHQLIRSAAAWEWLLFNLWCERAAMKSPFHTCSGFPDLNSRSDFSVYVVNLVSVSVFYRWKDTNQRQVPGGLHRPSAAGAGEGVSLQQIHHHQEEGGARHSAQPVRETGTPTHERWNKHWFLVEFRGWLSFTLNLARN